jgi:O-acetyl-ADP-ribose deacetylase (regulator of RNase III)
MNISIIKGDITKAPVDAIVNAANQKMLGGGGVDGAIHEAAGPKLLSDCYKVKSIDGIRCPTGEARITNGADLKARYVIHTVGPRYGIDDNPEKLLLSAYGSSLELGKLNGCKSIAFPAISCGVYGYPHEEAAKIALTACMNPKYQNIEIHFYLFNDRLMAVWELVKENIGKRTT